MAVIHNKDGSITVGMIPRKQAPKPDKSKKPEKPKK